MCSISASLDRDRLIALCKQNEYRGQHSHSISYFTLSGRKIGVDRKLGPIDYEDIIQFNCYYIVHQQAPTSENENIHPAEFHEKLLWHNGILKPSTIKNLQDELNDSSTWDSYLLCKYLGDHIGPENIDGSFACIFWEGHKELTSTGDFYMFRNELAPLFINDEYDISSTKFEGSRSIEPNKFFGLTLTLDNGKGFMDLGLEFSTLNNPYVMEKND